MKILDVPMDKNDAEAATVREYLKKLLSTLWEEDDGFSGKRPFGNSGWKYDVYAALIKAELVAGRLDSDGYVDEVAQADADDLIQKAIAGLQ